MPKIENVPGVGRVRVYDYGERSADRYTVMLEEATDGGKPAPYAARPYLGLSANPSHPQGISQWGEAQPGPHLGKRIPFASLPENVQAHVRARMAA